MSVARRATAAAGQLSLELTSRLPALDIEPDWKVQQRLWGHSFHPMCSYLASFPAALAHAFIDRYSRPGDVVVDPFSGRGTTPLQAAAEGRIGVGNDLNPFAHLLTAAKVEPAARAETTTRLLALGLGWRASAPVWLEAASAIVAETGRAGSSGVLVPGAGSRQLPGPNGEPVAPEVAVAFHPETLAQVLYVRSELRLDDRTDRFLAASLAGALHGKTPSYLSTVMPNTFSMAPRYVRDFVRRSDFAAPRRDLFELLDGKLRRLYRDPVPGSPGIALLGDARDASGPVRRELRARGLPERSRLVVSSPPYLRVVKYGYYNWLRSWLLGFDSAAIDASLDDAHHREPYLRFLREVLADLRGILADDAVVVLVIGDVETDRGRRISHGVQLAEAVWEAAAEPEGYRLAGLALDEVSATRKMTRLWGDEAGRATKVDRILVMGATEQGRRRARSGASLPVDWSWPPRRLRAL